MPSGPEWEAHVRRPRTDAVSTDGRRGAAEGRRQDGRRDELRPCGEKRERRTEPCSGWSLCPEVWAVDRPIDPMLKESASIIARVRAGRTLMSELCELVHGGVDISLQAFAPEFHFRGGISSMRAAVSKFYGADVAAEGDEGGKTTGLALPRRCLDDGGLSIVKTRSERPAEFRVFVQLPLVDTHRGQKTAIQGSYEYELFGLVETVFHELLHVWYASVIADPASMYHVNVDREESIRQTGHDGDTRWRTDPETLELFVGGHVERDFETRIRAFHEDVIRDLKLRQFVKEVRKRQ